MLDKLNPLFALMTILFESPKTERHLNKISRIHGNTFLSYFCDVIEAYSFDNIRYSSKLILLLIIHSHSHHKYNRYDKGHLIHSRLKNY
jgi:hypothetical protein